MKRPIKHKLACMLGGNVELNRKVLNLKKSWDEVECILRNIGKKKGSSREERGG